MKKIGILGGGQLGRMFLQESISFDIHTSVMDKDISAPCRHLCDVFVQKDVLDFDAVYQFGQSVDILTIEIENVHIQALEQLSKEGKEIIPHPSALKIISDKGKQKEFYLKNNIPTSPFVCVSNKEEIYKYTSYLPAFQKARKGGYDGKGVFELKDKSSISKAIEGNTLIEKKILFEKEISVIVARDSQGNMAVYPVVEMVFNSQYNLVDYLISPANIGSDISKKAQQIALDVVQALNSPGIFAVEMFLLPNGDIYVNETAPRAHNSGHQSIEGNVCSQYQQHLRILLGYPLGSVKTIKPSAMLNLVGSKGAYGKAIYEGVKEVLSKENLHLHLYGKKEVRPGRKMGHITILSDSQDQLSQKINFVKQVLRAKGKCN